MKDLIEGNRRIKLIIKPIEQFYNYKYKNYWIRNHRKNVLLNKRIGWELNMLWSEKVHFVFEAYKKKYFKTDFYGWCDIGYFRARDGLDMCSSEIKQWPSKEKVSLLHPDKIFYALVNEDMDYIKELNITINVKTKETLLPHDPIPADQISIAGGFFITHKKNLWWWKSTYDKKLDLYFQNEYLVKDDQIIIADCCFSHDTRSRFALLRDTDPRADSWFMFQRILI